MEKSWIDAYLDQHWEEMVEAMKTLMRIPSVSGEPEGAYPFGKNCAEVLDTAFEMGRKMGMDTQNDDYYGGSILMRGEKGEEIGIFAHLDVVPEGTGWMQPPYAPYVRDNWLFGRGSADDKGAAVLALYAMDCVKQSGVLPKRTVRLYLGCSEECGMKDISSYLERHTPPAFSFVPDASFSVCYAEKGICEVELCCRRAAKALGYDAGTVSNAVAGLAHADFAGQAPAFDEARWPISTSPQRKRLHRGSRRAFSPRGFPGRLRSTRRLCWRNSSVKTALSTRRTRRRCALWPSASSRFTAKSWVLPLKPRRWAG